MSDKTKAERFFAMYRFAKNNVYVMEKQAGKFVRAENTLAEGFAKESDENANVQEGFCCVASFVICFLQW